MCAQYQLPHVRVVSRRRQRPFDPQLASAPLAGVALQPVVDFAEALVPPCRANVNTSSFVAWRQDRQTAHTHTRAANRCSTRSSYGSDKTGNRLQQQMIDESTREPVDSEDKARGYGYAKNSYIIAEDEELEAVGVESTTLLKSTALCRLPMSMSGFTTAPVT
jgi:hypothetical protein